MEEPVEKGNFGNLRRKVTDRIPEATKILNKSGTPPTNRQLISTAGALLRRDIARENAEEKAEIDPLTGLYNRNGLNRRLKEEVARSKRSKKSFTCIILDTNNLKEVNDTQGHSAGDNLLKKIAESLKRVSRKTDILVRYGGDEFIILLSETDSKAAREYWENRLNPDLILGNISISAGMAEIYLENPEESIAQADKAMYKAKILSRTTKKNEIMEARLTYA